MRRPLTLALGVALAAPTAHAQIALGNYSLTSFGLAAGVEDDRVLGKDADFFFTSAGLDPGADVRGIVDSRDSDERVNANTKLRADVSLRNRGLEFRVGVYGIFSRLDAIAYAGEGRTLNIASVGHEIGAEAAHLWRSNAWPHFHAYGGVGLQLGYGFGTDLHTYFSPASTLDELSFRENGRDVISNRELERAYGERDGYRRDDVQDAIDGRAFVLGGLAVDIRERLELNTEGRFGFGYRENGEEGAATRLSGVSVGLRWNLVTAEELGGDGEDVWY